MERFGDGLPPHLRRVNDGHISFSLIALLVLAAASIARLGYSGLRTAPASPEEYVLGVEVTDQQEPDGSLHHEITLSDRYGGHLARLTDDPTMHYFEAALSPDLEMLAFYGRRFGPDGENLESGIYVADLQRRLDGFPARARSPWLIVPIVHWNFVNASPCWLDDGRIAYSAPLENGPGGSGPVLWAVDVQTGETARITSDSGVCEGYPAYSPVTRLIAFARRSINDRQRRWDIHTCEADGSDIRRVTTPKNSTGLVHLYPQWSPDGRSLVFSTGGVRYRIAANGSQPAVPVPAT